MKNVRLWLFSLALLSMLIALFLGYSSIPSEETPSHLQSTPSVKDRGIAQAGTQLRVGFWSIRELSYDNPNQSEQDGNRTGVELGQIAQIIRHLDCIAICGIQETEALDELVRQVDKFGGAWAAISTNRKSGNSVASEEYYGWLFRKDKIHVRRSPGILEEVSYAVDVGGRREQRRFDREPAVCAFASLDGRLDFTMVVVHLASAERGIYSTGEIHAVRDYFLQVQDEDSEDDDVILCGDFNRNIEAPESLTELLNVPSMVDAVTGSMPTMVDGKNSHDHLLFQADHVREYTGERGVIAFDESMFGGDDTKAVWVASEHRPIWVVLAVPATDDD